MQLFSLGKACLKTVFTWRAFPRLPSFTAGCWCLNLSRIGGPSDLDVSRPIPLVGPVMMTVFPRMLSWHAQLAGPSLRAAFFCVNTSQTTPARAQVFRHELILISAGVSTMTTSCLS